MRHLKRITIVAFILAMIITVVCPPPAPANLLVSKEDAMTILGDTVAEPTIDATESGMAPPGRRYHYSITGAPANGGMTGSMVIHLYDAATMAGDDGLYKTAQDYFSRRKEAMINSGKRNGRVEVEEMTGIGDSAYWAPHSHTLHFMSQGAYVSVKINDLTTFSGADQTELENKISAHRRLLAEKIASLIIPQLEVR